MNADAVAPSVLRARNASGLHAVERALADLHREMLRTDEDARVVRLAVVTLVVACVDAAAAERATDVIGRVAAEHPARAILVLAEPEASEPGIDAELSLQCSVVGGHDRVCAEQVRLTVRGAPAYHLVSVVTPLLLPDVPVLLWLSGAVPLQQALTGDTPALCERIVVDSDAYADARATLTELAAAVTRPEDAVPLADVAWARVLPWREALAQAFDGAAMRPYLAGVEEVVVDTAGPVPAARSLLLAGWLGSRLRGRDGSPVPVRVAGAGGSGGGPERVVVRCTDPDRGAAEVEVRADGAVLATRVVAECGMATSRAVPLARPPLADLVGSLLEETGSDPVHVAALRAAADVGADR